ncbi:hypothetical protein [Singulisphaera acidiphila]|uniref:Uncharacterized protein n=1 Tax=Singulisphaera acidiphila (strain ATCC BAA-1392 / DSM 18658 / VKM B-2454 / MOB10) TaxID=886293 RepID=L0D9J2_SINAD|nr:hypothetical protein [Singulisphaera acidiphila]AGA25535.1 hypothetical protein Sinac_1139 [Singulisphaera acidiphila DSM 18658]
MRPGLKTLLGATLVAPSLFIALTSPLVSYGDEPSRLGRLFRFGGNSTNSAPQTPAPTAPAPRAPAPSEPSQGMLFSAATPAAAPANNGPTPRLVPQPRVSRASTEADPILSRISLVRSSDGNQFGMCLQVYADGTVLDNEGTHHLSQTDLKPLVELLESGDLFRAKGHCGAPATDFVEQVHIVAYERSLGRLRANAFSYSGNPQGCDHAVRHLHTVLEGLQAKLSRPAMPATPVGAGVPSTLVPTGEPAPAGNGPTISLTPSN